MRRAAAATIRRTPRTPRRHRRHARRIRRCMHTVARRAAATPAFA